MVGNAIQLAGVRKAFGAKVAVDDVSLTIAPGEMVSLLGPSGSGKSTALRMISGLLRSDTGQVAVYDRPVQSDGRLAGNVRALRRDVGMIFQQFNLVDRLSLLTNVLAGRLGHMPGYRANLGLFSKTEKRIALEALERVGMLSFARQRASTLSGGQQQRAAIARALTQQASIILADEPIASLDPAAADRVMRTLRRINREDGVTVVVSLHQVDYALKYCDRIVALQDGRLTHDGPAGATTSEFFTELYGRELHDEAAEEKSVAAPAARQLAVG